MVLARLIGDLPGELEADLLQHYGIDLEAARETGTHSPPQIARLTLQLPAGSRVWRAIGGWAAITPEERQLLVIEFRQRNRLWQAAGGKGQKPEPPKPPKGWLVEQVEEQQAQQRWEDKALAWKRRNESRYAEMEKRAIAARAAITKE